jgi:hypothetical protein
MAELDFDDGFHWAGTFVKRGAYAGQPIAFRISPQLLVNRLPIAPGAGPAEILLKNDELIKAACHQAVARAKPGIHTVDLSSQDFDAAEFETV